MTWTPNSSPAGMTWLRAAYMAAIHYSSISPRWRRGAAKSLRELSKRQLQLHPSIAKVRSIWFSGLKSLCWYDLIHICLQDTDDCVLCLQSSETIDYLLVACVFSREVWYRGASSVRVAASNPKFDWLLLWLVAASIARKRVPKVQRRGYDALVLLAGWMIWKERNARTFRAEAQTPSQLVLAIKEEATQWDLARYRHFRSLIVPEW